MTVANPSVKRDRLPACRLKTAPYLQRLASETTMRVFGGPKHTYLLLSGIKLNDLFAWRQGSNSHP